MHQRRFGRPQFIAAAMLLIFLGECLFTVARAPLDHEEFGYVYRGLHFFADHVALGDREHSPLVGIIAASPLVIPGVDRLVFPASRASQATLIEPQSLSPWLLRLPFVFFGLLRGASLWYIARRL